MKYGEYRESDIPWMKPIPSHWKTCRAKNLYQKEKRLPLDNDDVVTCFRDGTVTLRKNRRTTGFTESIKEIGYQGIHKGDLVIHVMDAFAGAVGVSDSNGKGTPVYSVCTAKGNSNNYYYAYAVREMAKTGYIQSLYRGIRERSSDFRFEVFANQIMPVPPREEQDQIVSYLDWQISKINKLVVAKKNEVELVKEICNTQFRTCNGVNSAKFKRVVKLLEDFIDIEPEQKYQKTGMYNRGRGIFMRDAINGSEIGDSKFQRIRRDCILISGQFAWEGAAYITEEKDVSAIASHRYYVLQPSRSDVPIEYIWTYLMSEHGLMEMNRCSHGAAGRNKPLNIRELLNIDIPLPAQGSNLNGLKNAVRVLMKLNSCLAKRQIILSELKNRIISDVVTGQVNISSLAIPDFEQVEETDTEETYDDESLESEEAQDGQRKPL